MRRLIVSLIAGKGRLEAGKELRRQDVLGLAQLLHQLADRVEVDQATRLLVLHVDALALLNCHSACPRVED